VALDREDVEQLAAARAAQNERRTWMRCAPAARVAAAEAFAVLNDQASKCRRDSGVSGDATAIIRLPEQVPGCRMSARRKPC
jgi:hypothetical protein